MQESKFYWHIHNGEYAIVSYPLQGISILLPHGKRILSNIEEGIYTQLSSLDYQLIDFPEAVPSEFTDHLIKRYLFETKNLKRSFFLSGSCEMQSAYTAKHLVYSYRDMPLKFYSKTTVHRENNTSAMIKDIEYTSFELNAFFASMKEAISEKEDVNKIIANQLQILEIPFISVNQLQDQNGPTVFYVFFPFSESFGSVFWSSVVGVKYTQALDFQFRNSADKIIHPIQFNAGFTSRILAAYLANHSDEQGFLLQPHISPADVLISKEPGQKYDSIRFRKKAITSKGYRTLKSKFLSMGIPIMLYQGQHEINVTYRRSLDSEWVRPENLDDNLYQYLNNQQGNTAQLGPIVICATDNFSDQTNKKIIYKVPFNKEQEWINGGMKKLGYLDPNNLAFVAKKY
ncbi:MAG: hypothetical protein KJ718_01985 [Nanoarchaeota archaeon]|nr:hypothetical protein [Nanoarchaeota archaeon]